MLSYLSWCIVAKSFIINDKSEDCFHIINGFDFITKLSRIVAR